MATKRKTKRKGKARGGAPSKLTPEVHAEILKWLNAGAYKKHAAEAAGVSVDSMDNWLKRGEGDDAVEPYKQFALDVRQNQATHAVRNQAVISKAAETDWKAAAWDLERRYPKLYALQVRLEHTGEDGGPIRGRIDYSRLSDKQLDQLEKLLALAEQTEESPS